MANTTSQTNKNTQICTKNQDDLTEENQFIEAHQKLFSALQKGYHSLVTEKAYSPDQLAMRLGLNQQLL